MIHRVSRLATIGCLSFGVTMIAACASTVMVRVDDNSPETREVQKMDCSVYDNNGQALRSGADFGAYFGPSRGGPYVASWERSVLTLVGQYKELCARHNSGAISLAAYNTRLAEIDQLWAEAQGIRQSVDETIRGHGRDSFNELEGATSRSGAISNDDAERVAAAIDALAGKLGGR